MSSSQEQQAEVERRRRLAEIFGDALPERTSDEIEERPATDGRGGARDDEWLRSQVPPHHG